MPANFEQDRINFRARKFLMWLFLVSSFIYFAGLTSGFVVYTAGSPNRGIKTLLPGIFVYSTVLIVLSSVSMYLAYRSAKGLDRKKQTIYLLITMALGIAFFFCQLDAWKSLISQGIYFSFNPNASQSFLYVFTGSHLAHIVVGVLMLLYTLVKGVRHPDPVRNQYRMEVTSIFWHFIDILWIYLYVFLLLNQ
jgi:cytochrome c oxidase subunit 3